MPIALKGDSRMTPSQNLQTSHFTANAVKVLEKRYLTKGADGRPLETVDSLFRRVSEAIAAAENSFPKSPWKMPDLANRFFQMMVSQDFMPNSPTLMNAGKPLGQLSACFVLPVADSMDSIFESIKNAAMIHKSGGGTGFSFSRLRPANDIVGSTGGVSSGPVSFMKVFNVATETIKQGGTRRGANMGILRVDHPDIVEFLKSKEDNTALTNFNISIAVTNIFMEAVEKDAEYDLFNPRTQKPAGRLRARKIFHLIVERAWRNGEPGIIFLDRLNRDNPTPQVGEIESTNPCGEQPLLPYESCNLGSINLANFVLDEPAFPRLDFQRLRETIHLAVRFLDNVIEVNKYPIPEIDQMTKANRKIGLGIMGWADMLIKMNIPYDSESALSLADEIMGFIRREGWIASGKLAEERGTFPNFCGSALEKKGTGPVRNATVTTIAPTGTISLLANCSSGIEPLFALAFEKHVMDGERLIEVNPFFSQALQQRGINADEILPKVVKSGTIKGIEAVPDELKRRFVTSHDISPEWHIRMQAAFQKHTDNAVSKTVNFPHTATIKDVETVYRMAHTLGCKGVTVYRDGSRDEQVLNVGIGKDKAGKVPAPKQVQPRPRPELTQGFTERVQIGCGNLYVTVNSDDKGICEVFTSLGRGGGCPSQSEATARLVSTALRAGMDPDQIIDQLKGIRCLSTLKRGGPGNGIKVLSCPDAIGRAIERYKISRAAKDEKAQHDAESKGQLTFENIAAESAESKGCPDCSAELEHEGGCVICRTCGFSRCG
jgi:ribonucleoside-diphosphate reductase alpha chain